MKEKGKYFIKHVLPAVLGMGALALFFGWEYKLKPVCMGIVASGAVLTVPFLLKNALKRKKEEKRFSDAAIYMNQMLYAFLRKPKVFDALKDTFEIFPEGDMRETLEQALRIYQEPESAVDLNRTALAVIEQSYPNDRLKRMHEYFCKVENIGGNYKSGIEAQILDRNRWIEGIEEHKVNVKKYRSRVRMAVLAVTAVCGILPQLIGRIEMFTMQMSDVPLYEIATVVFLLLELFIYLKADGKLNVDWLNEHPGKQYDMQEKYIRAISYDAAKGFKTSLLYACVPAVLGVVSLVFKFIPGACVCGAFTVFMLFQHKIGHQLNVRQVKREIEKQFPAWLMEIVLRLQTGNVQVAIRESEETAPPVLREAVHELVLQLEEKPESIEPYANFLKAFKTPEIDETMKRFYSMSAQGIGDTEKEIVEIIERSNRFIQKAERMRHEDEEGAMFGLIIAPQLPVILEVIVGFYALLLVFFSAFTVL